MPSVSLRPLSGRCLSFEEREEIALRRVGGAGVREIQVLLRHKHLTTTARYLHSTFRDLREVHRKFHPHENRTETKEGEQNGNDQKGPASWRDLRNHR